MSEEIPSPATLVQEWFRRARQNQRLHYRCAVYYSRRNQWLGIPAVVLSAIVASAVFASIQNEASGGEKVLLGLLSITAAVLTSLQTFLSYAERAERHRVTSAQYASIRRRLEVVTALDGLQSPELRSRLETIQNALDSCAESAPHVPQHLEQEVKMELTEHRDISGKK